ncbi:MAG: hypothetical protein ABSA47_12205 [Verrucomicrobiota bacterium]|jgi:hypothetical protein
MKPLRRRPPFLSSVILVAFAIPLLAQDAAPERPAVPVVNPRLVIQK